MTRKEIHNIVNNGFSERRKKQKLRAKKNSARTKAWKLREAFLTEGLPQEEIKRKKHYTGLSAETENKE